MYVLILRLCNLYRAPSWAFSVVSMIKILFDLELNQLCGKIDQSSVCVLRFFAIRGDLIPFSVLDFVHDYWRFWYTWLG